jgi:hypothetical protein
MKNAFRAGFLITVVLLLMVIVTPWAKGETVSTEIYPVNESVWIPCANGGSGEDVLLIGQLRVQISAATNDNHEHFKIRSQPLGLYGLGLVTGDVYHAVGVTQTEYSCQIPPGQQFQETYVNNYRIIGRGPGNNFMVHEVFHVTHDASGEIAVVFDNTSSECK